ncbi:MAG: cell division protein ZapB [Nitrospirales bacterium]|nr:cell division protein ZapB [Nitrospirales bacterium]
MFEILKRLKVAAREDHGTKLYVVIQEKIEDPTRNYECRIFTLHDSRFGVGYSILSSKPPLVVVQPVKEESLPGRFRYSALWPRIPVRPIRLTAFPELFIFLPPSIIDRRCQGVTVSLEKLEALEVRVRKLVDLLVELRKDKAQLGKQLQKAQEDLDKQKALLHVLEEERTSIRSRIEKVLDELEILDHGNESPGGGA